MVTHRKKFEPTRAIFVAPNIIRIIIRVLWVKSKFEPNPNFSDPYLKGSGWAHFAVFLVTKEWRSTVRCKEPNKNSNLGSNMQKSKFCKEPNKNQTRAKHTCYHAGERSGSLCRFFLMGLVWCRGGGAPLTCPCIFKFPVLGPSRSSSCLSSSRCLRPSTCNPYSSSALVGIESYCFQQLPILSPLAINPLKSSLLPLIKPDHCEFLQQQRLRKW